MTWQATHYRCQATVVRHDVPGVWDIVSVPYPLARARVNRRLDNRYQVSTLSTSIPIIISPGNAASWATWGDALAAAYEWVSRTAGQEMRDRFTGPQRVVMGQQRCPRLLRKGLCQQAIVPGTIWCPDHPKGEVSR